MELFLEKGDSRKQCLFVVGSLAGPEELESVHRWVLWSQWHQSVPCTGASEVQPKLQIADGLGNARPYYDEHIRQAIYYCRAPEFLALEKALARRLEEGEEEEK